MEQATYILQKDLPDGSKPNDKYKYIEDSDKVYMNITQPCKMKLPFIAVENNPEWFKKEEPKQEWEILSFLIIRHKEVVRVVDNPYAFAASQYLKYPDEYSIHSVKRLSDNSIWEVNKNAFVNGYVNTIQRFELDNKYNSGNMTVWFNGINMPYDLSELTSPPTSKPEEPLPIKVTKMGNLKTTAYQGGELAMWVSTTKEIPTEKYEPIKQAIECLLNNYPLAVFEEREVLSIKDVKECYKSPHGSPLFNDFIYHLYNLVKIKS